MFFVEFAFVAIQPEKIFVTRSEPHK